MASESRERVGCSVSVEVMVVGWGQSGVGFARRVRRGWRVLQTSMAHMGMELAGSGEG